MAATHTPDQIWLDRERKLTGICSELRRLGDAGSDVLLLAHFDETLRLVEAALRERSIAYHSYSAFDESVLFSPNERSEIVWVGLARNFHPRAPGVRNEVSGRNLSIIVAEHHPLFARDQAVVEAAGNLAVNYDICFHASLTDPFLIHFGSEQILGLIKQLGMDEESSLSNRLIDSAIRAAQEDIANRVNGEMPASSAEDWFKYNLRP